MASLASGISIAPLDAARRIECESIMKMFHPPNPRFALKTHKFGVIDKSSQGAK
jgi:hypothetical protein